MSPLGRFTLFQSVLVTIITEIERRTGRQGNLPMVKIVLVTTTNSLTLEGIPLASCFGNRQEVKGYLPNGTQMSKKLIGVITLPGSIQNKKQKCFVFSLKESCPCIFRVFQEPRFAHYVHGELSSSQAVRMSLHPTINLKRCSNSI